MAVFLARGAAFKAPHKCTAEAQDRPFNTATLLTDHLLQELKLVAAGEGISISVAGGGGSDVVTLSPVAQAGGIMLAPVGLVGMLNAGGAVLRWVDDWVFGGADVQAILC